MNLGQIAELQWVSPRRGALRALDGVDFVGGDYTLTHTDPVNLFCDLVTNPDVQVLPFSLPFTLVPDCAPFGSADTSGCGNTGICDTIDFNNDGVYPDTTDLFEFIAVHSGATCSSQYGCNDIDFNNDGVFPETSDLFAFIDVFGGSGCTYCIPDW